ncbi:MAG: protoporphyrinogen oxidase [Calditrichaeota bacterium]|nr:protoporphyrinogen oxidase [Calditrichota bacterium]MCB9369835.1 protoporphyrinogen oxidase [Calditrichota bacterium]
MLQPSDPLSPKVVIVGGGIAGLATAYLVRELGRERGANPQITILESKNMTGGATRTDHVDGFTCEWGPNGFLDNEPATLDLIERLGLKKRLVKASSHASKRYIYHHGQMHEVPLSPRQFLSSSILPVKSKLRVAMELAVPAKRDGEDETVYNFARRRLGDTFAHYMIDPMVSGIFAGNAKELSLRAVFPKMVEMETDHGGLFRAMIAKKREAKRNGKISGGPGGAAATLTTFENGMGELTDTLAAELKENIITNCEVKAVLKQGESFEVVTNGQTHSADVVILACPSYAAAEIVSELSFNAAEGLRAIPFAPVDVVAHGHKIEDVGHSLDGFGVLIPRGEDYRALGSLWCDAIFPGQAPAGTHMLRTMIGGAHDPDIVELSDRDVESLAAKEHRKLFNVKRDPVFRKLIRHPKGIAQYTRGHLDRVRETEILERQLPGLLFTGASYRGVSVNGCAKDAFRVANLLLDMWRLN